jgi:hypothetical protein
LAVAVASELFAGCSSNAVALSPALAPAPTAAAINITGADVPVGWTKQAAGSVETGSTCSSPYCARPWNGEVDAARQFAKCINLTISEVGIVTGSSSSTRVFPSANFVSPEDSNVTATSAVAVLANSSAVTHGFSAFRGSSFAGCYQAFFTNFVRYYAAPITLLPAVTLHVTVRRSANAVVSGVSDASYQVIASIGAPGLPTNALQSNLTVLGDGQIEAALMTSGDAGSPDGQAFPSGLRSLLGQKVEHRLITAGKR